MKLKKKNKRQIAWQKKYPNGKAPLSWELDDYQVWQIEPPKCLFEKPSITEGMCMTDDDIDVWLTDSIKTLKILKETEPKVFQRLHQELILDANYLISINKFENKHLDFIGDKNNFDF